MFQFGGFTLDIHDHTLKQSEQPISLRPKSFETLAFLVEHRGRLVSKDELLERVWAGVVVTDGALTHCIEEIRHVIGDDPHHPHFIQTVPRVGYRFIAQVQELPDGSTEEEVVEEEEYTTLNVRFRGDDEVGTETHRHVKTLPERLSPPGRLKLTTVAIIASAILVLLAIALVYILSAGRSGAITSLAVMPFENLSRDPEQDYFADGLTDALIAEIAKIGRLRVISRTSAMQYKNSRKSISEIAEELQVDGVIEGSVFRSGERVRITAALIATGGERRLWGETYERDQRDMVTLLRVMARTLAQEIPIELTPTERARFSRDASVDPVVYELYLKGRYHWNKRTAEGFRKGIECFETALARDPYYAPAYVGLADSYNMLGDYDLLPPKMAFPKARAAALQALAVDNSLAEAHASLAFSAMRFDWDWAEVEREYGLAIASDPNSSNAHHWYGLYLATRGRFDDAGEELRKAHALDPLALIITANLAWVHYFAREYDQAIMVCKEALELDSSFTSAHVKLGWAYEQKQMYREARGEFRTAINSEGNDPILRLFLAHAFAVEGARGDAIALMQEVTEHSHDLYLSGYHVAAVYAGLRDRARSLEWLKKAYGERSGWLAWLNVDPKFDDLRGESQFVALLDSLRLR
jgi:TolB-like protein/DNA-binding winged helix-turn-helix (wHTH) protein/tetratricopeptide (TPR) repeat protein